MDLLVLQSQQWLNATYAGKAGFARIGEDGSTGWQTMYALTRALQIELGIATPSDNFGPTTMSTLASKFGTIGVGFTKNKNVVTIIQCALWCKGYAGGMIVPFGELNPAKSVGTFTNEVGAAVASIRADMGLAASPTVPPKVFKSLLNMDAYVTVNGGSSTVRTVQQFLNGRYWEREDFRIMPCDGHYSRDVQQGLMYAIQYGLGMADDERRFVSLFQGALIFNGYDSDFNGKYSSKTQAAAKAFQSFCELPAHGSADFATWASLLVSTGDPDRPVTVCDTSTPLTRDTAAQLASAGFRAIGRYLNGYDKGLRAYELTYAAEAGLSIFPIYQEWNSLEELREYGAETFGYRQGRAASLRARQIGFPTGTTIYFPIDADATADEIEALVLDYYRGVRKGVALSSSVPYKVGCYGPRNVGIKVSEAGLAESTFVAGLSTGWSANLGFPLPKNWAYDQINETSTGSGSRYIEIDRNASSGRAKPVGMKSMLPVPTAGGGFDTVIHWPFEEYCFQAEVFREEEIKSLSNDDLTQIILNQLQRTPDAEGNAREWNINFVAFSPFSPTLEPHRVLFENRVPRIGARPMRGEDPGEVDARAVSLHHMLNSPSYDVPHFAASLRGYMQWGAYSGSPETQVGDLGAWALDLAQAWKQYEIARTKPDKHGNLYKDGVIKWFARIGAPSDEGEASGFGYADLIADIDAYLAAIQLRDSGETLSHVMREIWQRASRDHLYRRRSFASVRFNLDKNVAQRAVRHLLTTPSFWIDTPTGRFIGPRRPGERKDGIVLPPEAVLAKEVDDVATAFTSMIFDGL